MITRLMPQTGIVRERLFDLIGKPRQAAVTLITAPAGYGKSTLASQWVAVRDRSHVWINVRPSHDSPKRLMDRIWKSLATLTANPPTVPDLMTPEAILDLIRSLPGTLDIILDDFQLVSNHAAHIALEQLITHLPDKVHLFVLSRRTPDFALARLRAYGLLREISLGELAFTCQEVEEVLAGSGLNSSQIETLHRETEGWITAIRMTMMSVDPISHEAAPVIDDVLAAIHENRLIETFIREEIIDPLPGEIKQFVCDSVLLDRLNTELCDAALKTRSSGLYLGQVTSHQLLMAADSGDRGDLHYHPLFASVVRRYRKELKNAQPEAKVFIRAARWYVERGDLQQATLYAIKAEEWKEAARLIRSAMRLNMAHPHVLDIVMLVDKLPISELNADPDILHAAIMVLLSAGQVNQAVSRVHAFDQLEMVHSSTILKGKNAFHHAVIAETFGDYGTATAESIRALHYLPGDAALERIFAWTSLFRSASNSGEMELAHMALRQAEACQRRLPEISQLGEILINPEFANSAAVSGDLRLAENILRYVIRSVTDDHSVSGGDLTARLIRILVEQNRLDEAEAEIAALTEHIERQPMRNWVPDALRTIATVHLAQGDPIRAMAILRRAQKMARERGGFTLNRRLEAFVAQVRLHIGQTDLVKLWWSRLESPALLSRSFGDVQLAAIHLQLLLSDHRLEEAETMVSGYLAEAQRRSNVAAEIELSVWASIIAEQRGDGKSSREHLAHALRLGAPGGFFRVYFPANVDITQTIRSLVPELGPSVREFALRVSGGTEDLPGAVEKAPTREQLSLTPRELGVLEELRAGKTNREIADSLSITERTVKKHVANLIQKSNTTNRTGVVLWALSLAETPRRSQD